MKRRRRGALVLAMLGLAVLAVPAVGAKGSLASQRSWMRAHGVNPGEWVSRNGGKVGVLTRTSAREVPKGNWAKAAPPNVDCMRSCHDRRINALRTKVTSGGFKNLQGNTATFVGSLYPYALLTDPRNTTKHAEIFRTKGCGGCHSKSAASARGKSTLTGCKSCHNFSFLGWDPARFAAEPSVGTNTNGHYHIIVTAEAPLSDPANAGKPACIYCHKNDDPVNGKASCWNCHLSGHWPQVPYWKEVG